MECIVCGHHAEHHHIKTRKAHPELIDAKFNKIPLCREHHTRWHSVGAKKMARMFPSIDKWMKTHGWYYDLVLLRWEHAPD